MLYFSSVYVNIWICHWPCRMRKICCWLQNDLDLAICILARASLLQTSLVNYVILNWSQPILLHRTWCHAVSLKLHPHHCMNRINTWSYAIEIENATTRLRTGTLNWSAVININGAPHMGIWAVWNINSILRMQQSTAMLPVSIIHSTRGVIEWHHHCTAITADPSSSHLGTLHTHFPQPKPWGTGGHARPFTTISQVFT